jgi:hypothetical protein
MKNDIQHLELRRHTMAERAQEFPQEALEKVLAVMEAERIVRGEKGYVTKEELEDSLAQLFGGIRFIGEEGYVTKEELEGLRRDVEQFLTDLSVMLLAYRNIGSEEYGSQGGI